MGTTEQHCPHCRQVTSQKVVRVAGAHHIYWCQTCFKVSTIDIDFALSIDPLMFEPELASSMMELDYDHRVMIDMLNDLRDLACNKDGKSVDALGNQFLRHLDTHFAREENVLKENNFPGLADHAAIHSRILRQVADTLAASSADSRAEQLDKSILSIRLLLTDHLIEDVAYKQFFASQVAKRPSPA